MNVTIEIDCEDGDEILAHLAVIRRDLKKEIKKQGGWIKDGIDFADDNCYGTHQVIVIPDCDSTRHFPDGNGFCLSCGAQLGIEVVIVNR